MELQVAEVLGGLLGHAVVGAHDDVRDLHVHHDLARRVGRQRPVGARLHDRHLVARVGLAHRARHARLGRVHVGRHAGLGEAVALDELDPEALLELVVDVPGGGGGEAGVHLVGAVEVRGRDVPDEVADGADRVEDRRLGVDHLLPEAARREALGVGDAPAGDQRRVAREHLGVRVEERQAAEEGVLRQRLHRLAGRGRDHLEQAARREVVGGVLLDDALGAAGGARGEHDAGVVGPGVRRSRRARRRSRPAAPRAARAAGAGSGPSRLPDSQTITCSSLGSSALIRSRRSRYSSEMTSFLASTRLIVQLTGSRPCRRC